MGNSTQWRIDCRWVSRYRIERRKISRSIGMWGKICNNQTGIIVGGALRFANLNCTFFLYWLEKLLVLLEYCSMIRDRATIQKVLVYTPFDHNLSCIGQVSKEIVAELRRLVVLLLLGLSHAQFKDPVELGWYLGIWVWVKE